MNIKNLNKSFETQDLYLTAALSLSGTEPDSYYIIEVEDNCFIRFVWNNRANLPLQEIENGEIKFAIRDIQKIHRELTIEVLDIRKRNLEDRK